MPMAVGDPELALRMCDAALSRGVFVEAIGPPAVAADGARRD